MEIISPWLDVSKLPNCMKELSELQFDGIIFLIQLPAGAYNYTTRKIEGRIEKYDITHPYVRGFREKINENSLQNYLNENKEYIIFLQPYYPTDTIYHPVNIEYPHQKHMTPNGKCFAVSRLPIIPKIYENNLS